MSTDIPEVLGCENHDGWWYADGLVPETQMRAAALLMAIGELELDTHDAWALAMDGTYSVEWWRDDERSDWLVHCAEGDKGAFQLTFLREGS